MKHKQLILILTIVIIAIILSACSGSATTATSWPGLTVDDQYAYVTYQTQVYAVNLENGLEKWRYPQEPNNNINFYADPSLSNDGQLIVGGYDSILYNLNAESGVENMGNWPFTQAKNRYIASALVAGGNIFAPAADQNLYALDLNGQLQWIFTAEGESWAQPISDVNCECIYLTSMDHTVYAIDPQDGSQIWRSPKLNGAIVGTPAYGENGVLYVGTFGAKLFALNAKDGSILWEFPTEGWIWSGPALVDGILYFGDLEGYFYAVDAKNGSEIWQRQLTSNQQDNNIVGSPLLLQDTIYITSEEGYLYKLDTSGNQIWKKEVGGKIYTSPKTSNGLILVAPVQTDELLVAYDEAGNEQWKFIPAEN